MLPLGEKIFMIVMTKEVLFVIMKSEVMVHKMICLFSETFGGVNPSKSTSSDIVWLWSIATCSVTTRVEML